MATALRTTTLKTAIRTYSYTKGLKDGTVTVPGMQFEHIEINPIIGAFRRMCRGLEIDVAEMADPLPYGLARNRKAMEVVVQFAHDQKILPRLVRPEDAFASNTLDLE